MPSQHPRIGILAHKSFMRDVPPAARPDIHACLWKLKTLDRDRWSSAGVRVKKLAGFAQPVFEARLNRGDRIVFTLQTTVSESFEGLHVVLWCAGHHDDAVRTAGRRMGISDPVVEDRGDLMEVPDAWGPAGNDGAIEVEAGEEREARPGGFFPLVEVSEADIDRWAESQIDPILHLTPEQRALTRAAEDQPVFLRGGVGTGKTTVLLYRMLKLLAAGSIERPAFLTYSRSLAGWCRSVFERLPGWERHQVEFTSLSGLLRARFGSPRGGKRLFKRAWSQLGLRGDPEAAWWELQRMRGSAAFRGQQPRAGEALPEHVSEPLKVAYDAYRSQLDGAPDVLDLAWAAYEHYGSPAASASLPFDAIFIDEAQDLTPIEWLVCILMGDRPRLAFFCGDEAQDIRDTRFSWEGVEAAMRLIGHRAPTFSCVELHGNRRTTTAIARFLGCLSERFDLGASGGSGGTGEGPAPVVCAATLDAAERAARQAGCPVLLDLTARSDRDAGNLFWVLDLDHIKGLEFQVLPVWAPSSAWPTDRHLARKLYTAASRALHGLVIFTDGGTLGRFEQVGASGASLREVDAFLEERRDLVAWDREAMARWKAVTFSQAGAWVRAGVCSWADFRSQLARWASVVSFPMATSWVRDGLCTWEPFQERLQEWARSAEPDLAATWVRDGLCLRREFADRASGWAWAARFDQAVAWVDAGLLGWEDFRGRVRDWLPMADLAVAEAWVASGVCGWLDFRERASEWVSEVTLDQARGWVEAGVVPWEALQQRIPGWYAQVDVEVGSEWVRGGLCTWEDLRSRVKAWRDAVSLDDAQAWVTGGVCTWEEVRHRVCSWTSEASFEQASAWVELGLCSWADFGERVDAWVPVATPEQAISWLRSGACAPAGVWEQVPRWRSTLTLQQAAELVDAGVCFWGGLAPRLSEWDSIASFEQVGQWVAEGLRTWRDFQDRIGEWKPVASREQAAAWVREGLCSWRDFEVKIEGWKPDASLEHACDWVDAGLATWHEFDMKLPRWAESAEPWRVEQWRQMGLVSRQVAKAALRRRR
jgi:hypothetical protein